MIKSYYKIYLLFFLIGKIFGQNFINADPFNIIEIEKKYLDSDSLHSSELIIRPILNNKSVNSWRSLIRTEFYFNSNAPNYENMGNKFIGKGSGSFTSINLSYIGKNISFSFEPYYFISQNKEVNGISREGIFSKLNDVKDHFDSPYRSLGLRETQLYIHQATIWTFEYSQLTNTIIVFFTGFHPDIYLLKLFGLQIYTVSVVSLLLSQIYLFYRILNHSKTSEITNKNIV